MDFVKGIIIQARTGSSRLPNKILQRVFEGKCILEIQIERLRLAFPDFVLVVATSTAVGDDLVEELCAEMSCNIYRGSEDDVLSRFIEAAKHYSISECYRVCADNPFLNIELMKKMSTSDHVDYISYRSSTMKPAMQTHFGIFAEYVTIAALQKVKDATDVPLYREHVTNYIYAHPEQFTIKWLEMPTVLDDIPSLRLTVDTEMDMQSATEVYSETLALGMTRLDDIINTVRSSKFLLKQMKTEIEKNDK